MSEIGAPDKPVGKDQVVEALLASADQMFSTSAPGDVSLRAIARDANVNHGLVHRHFGTRADLVDQLLERIARRWTEQLDEGGDPLDAVRAMLGGDDEAEATAGTWLRILAWSLLMDPPGERADAQRRYSTLDRIPALMDEDDLEEASITAAAALSLVFGWRFFHPYLRPALHLEDVEFATLQRAMDAFVGEIMGGSGADAVG